MAKKEVIFMNHPDPKASTSYAERNKSGAIEVDPKDQEQLAAHGFVVVDGPDVVLEPMVRVATTGPITTVGLTAQGKAPVQPVAAKAAATAASKKTA